MQDSNSDIVEALLLYIYTGHVDITNENIVDIFEAAHQFQLAPLMVACKDYMKQHMDASNCYGESFFSATFLTFTLL